MSTLLNKLHRELARIQTLGRREMSTLLNKLHRELTRLLLLAGTMGALMWLDTWLPVYVGRPELSPWLTSSALVLGVAAVSHLSRRVLMPKLDFQHIARAAVGTAAGAGLVFLGLCILLATLISSSIAMLR